MIGPEPMRRIFLISVRFGTARSILLASQQRERNKTRQSPPSITATRRVKPFDLNMLPAPRQGAAAAASDASFHARWIVILRLISSSPLDVAADAGDLLLRRGAASQDRVERDPQIASGDGDVIAGTTGVELASIGQFSRFVLL